MASHTDSNDFVAHQQSFAQFITLVKFSMASLALGVIALYFFVIAHNFWAGLFFIIVAVPAGVLVSWRGKAKS